MFRARDKPKGKLFQSFDVSNLKEVRLESQYSALEPDNDKLTVSASGINETVCEIDSLDDLIRVCAHKVHCLDIQTDRLSEGSIRRLFSRCSIADKLKDCSRCFTNSLKFLPLLEHL